MIECEIDKEAIRQRLIDELNAQGFSLDEIGLGLSDRQKEAVRAAHAKACLHLREKARKGLERHEPRLLKCIANGNDIRPVAISPRLIQVVPGSEHELMFRYARLHWSIPVSAGYGRRLRFLVWDDAHDKLMGILGLCDPVFALRARDQWIGWDKDQKRAQLANVMDAFVLGAVPPYAQLLGGKLVAMAAASNEIYEAFHQRYAQKPTRIHRKRTGPLALITTTSALGRSSLYNRLRYGKEVVFQSVGYTRGSGEFPFINGTYADLRELVVQTCAPTAKHARWGSGFRNRREVVLKALSILGLPRDLIYHGVCREIFVVPLARNAQAFLRGEADYLEVFDRPFDELARYWKERWALPRAARDPGYRLFKRESWRLWSGKA